ncbi:hypothetical protein HOLleu_27387 [Holothuria leucospilota]|uniref:Ig-like domain-containing protein n=1 Tax=Holothuria leucospilota TaxID=206669 RepID=A0A9Q1BQC7_HOLLE|nr:hypothetical protein HOLleu_27387 [Holothuria leucospilota]
METNQRYSILVKLFVIFTMQCLGTSQDQLKFKLQGRKTFKTGIRQYTTFQANTSRDVVCSTSLNVWNVSPEFTLLKEKVKINDVSDKHLSSISQKFHNSEEIKGNYSCRLNIKFEAHGRIYLSYTREENFNVQRRVNAEQCTTDVGQAGFEGERVTLICTRGKIRNKRKALVPNVNLSYRAIRSYSCVTGDIWNTTCDFSSIQIFPFLKVEISPSLFTSDSRLEFTCTSTPTRLMYWGVWGSNGDILNLDQYNTSLLVDTNITIKHVAQKSILHIAEAIPGWHCLVKRFFYFSKFLSSLSPLTLGGCWGIGSLPPSGA